MHKFRVGDYVERIGQDHDCLEVGGVAQVTKLTTGHNGQPCYELDVGGEHAEKYLALYLGNKGGKMEKPETQLEKDALASAKAEVVKQQIEQKSVAYKSAMNNYLFNEREAQRFRITADELAEVLVITTQEKKQLF